MNIRIAMLAMGCLVLSGPIAMETYSRDARPMQKIKVSIISFLLIAMLASPA
jgi:hypothetical protein